MDLIDDIACAYYVCSEYVLWLDGGVVDYPDDLVARLHTANPDGITAPLVLLDGSDSMQYHQRFCGAVNCGGSFVSSRSHKLHDPRGFLVAGLPVRTRTALPTIDTSLRCLFYSAMQDPFAWPAL